jgi:small nuclear ribonucleoprotein (snRNP)-like protein
MGPRIGVVCRNNPNRVVIACVDGRRLHGHVYNFSMANDNFWLFPEEGAAELEGIEVFFKDLKAVFFVKDFAGDPERHDLLPMKLRGHGRPLEVMFQDGEKITGTSEAYNAVRTGFFLFPFDKAGNNIRIFVVNKNVRQVKAF